MKNIVSVIAVGLISLAANTALATCASGQSPCGNGCMTTGHMCCSTFSCQPGYTCGNDSCVEICISSEKRCGGGCIPLNADCCSTSTSSITYCDGGYVCGAGGKCVSPSSSSGSGGSGSGGSTSTGTGGSSGSKAGSGGAGSGGSISYGYGGSTGDVDIDVNDDTVCASVEGYDGCTVKECIDGLDEEENAATYVNGRLVCKLFDDPEGCMDKILDACGINAPGGYYDEVDTGSGGGFCSVTEVGQSTNGAVLGLFLLGLVGVLGYRRR